MPSGSLNAKELTAGRSPSAAPPQHSREARLPDQDESERDVLSLVTRCKSGDRDAQRQLYEQFNHGIFRLMVRMAGIQEAPDLVQQTFLQVYRRLEQFRGRSRFTTWLYRIAINEVFQYRRRRIPVVGIATCDSGRPDPSPQRLEQAELLEKALSAIEDDLRLVFLMREVESLSYRDIANMLDVPEGTVASRLNRARHELQQQLLALGWQT